MTFLRANREYPITCCQGLGPGEYIASIDADSFRWLFTARTMGRIPCTCSRLLIGGCAHLKRRALSVNGSDGISQTLPNYAHWEETHSTSSIYDIPVISPCSSTSIPSARETLGSPGINIIEPEITTRNPAPADSAMSVT